MLRLSKLTDYGTVIMSFMASSPGQAYSAAEVAQTVGVGVSTASKVLKMLAREDLVQSIRGTHGGYRLARTPGEISVAEVVEAMEGPIGITECGLVAGLCAREEDCGVRGNWQRLGLAIRRTLDGVTLADMARPDMGPEVVDGYRPDSRRPAAAK